jgi:MraZ protein
MTDSPPPADPPAATLTPLTAKPNVPLQRPTYKVSDKGETLRDIARRTLGCEDRWQEIDRLNPDLFSQMVVPGGKVLQMPVDARVEGIAPSGSAGCSETQDARPSNAGSSGSGSASASVRPLPVVRSRTPMTEARVMQPLTGTFTCKMDDRQNLVLPGEVCAQLGKTETVLVTPGPDRCLWLCTQASAARVLERVEKSAAADREVQAFRRLYYSQSEKAVVDASGKLAIAGKLAEYAGLGKEIVLIGADDHFELWDAAGWQRYSQQKDSSSKP